MLASVSKKHLKRKDAIFKTFLGYLSEDKLLKTLIHRVSDPKEHGSLVTRFILVTRGPKDEKFYNFKQNHCVFCSESHNEQDHTRVG